MGHHSRYQTASFRKRDRRGAAASHEEAFAWNALAACSGEDSILSLTQRKCLSMSVALFSCAHSASDRGSFFFFCTVTVLCSTGLRCNRSLKNLLLSRETSSTGRYLFGKSGRAALSARTRSVSWREVESTNLWRSGPESRFFPTRPCAGCHASSEGERSCFA
jgi:hypothetical protein